MLNSETREMVLLEPGLGQKPVGPLAWLGLLLGALVGFLVLHPVAMVVRVVHDHIYWGYPLSVQMAAYHSFHKEMWPMMLLYTGLGALVGFVIGLFLKRLRENRRRLDALHQEFELQVATLRHQYKNLAIGIQGFARRIRGKLAALEQEVCQFGPQESSVHQVCQSLGRHLEILEEAAQRLTHVLGEELLFLKALTSDALTPLVQDFYAFLKRAIQDLLNLRFRDKHIRVEINGQPLEEFHQSLLFAFEPYTMEVILQNLLSNSMKFGDHLQVEVEDLNNRIRIGIKDNGPGLEVDQLKNRLLAPADRHSGESTHLGLRVTIHLIYKNGGRLWVWSQPGAGAVFVIEMPK